MKAILNPVVEELLKNEMETEDKKNKKESIDEIYELKKLNR